MRLPPSSVTVTLRQRRSFTLIELLVVLAIITVLAALSISAVMGTINYQSQKNTKFYMRELNGAMKKRWDAVVQSAEKEDMPQTIGAQPYAAIVAMAGDNGGPRTKAMYIKFRLKQEFPTSFAEALNPYPLPPKQGYVTYLQDYGITTTTWSTASPAPQFPCESAACLYMAMKQSPAGQNFKADQFANGVRELPVTVAGVNKQVKAFTDDWKNPLIFCRWATGDPVLDSLCPLQNTGTAMRDLQDPNGTLINQTWYATPGGRAAFETYGHSLTNGGGPYAYYTIPVLMSYGPDGAVGLSNLQTLQRDSTTASKDNIYSYNIDRE